MEWNGMESIVDWRGFRKIAGLADTISTLGATGRLRYYRAIRGWQVVDWRQ
jgi:hypothetical protein